MKKVLFLIHDLGAGGAEKVLVNLANDLDPERFDVTVGVLFGGGTREKDLKPHVHFYAVFPFMLPANSRWMKLFSPAALHRLCVRGSYDIEAAFLEGPSARVISGSPDPEVRLLCWIPTIHETAEELALSFRSPEEAVRCYRRFDRIACVSETVRDNFRRWLPDCAVSVVHNVIDSEEILSKARAAAPEIADDGRLRIVSAGTLKQVKGFDRLLKVILRMKSEGREAHLYLIGSGPMEKELKAYAGEHGLAGNVSFLGYQENPYRVMSRCSLYVCSSYVEGFSTAVAEALILGLPVVTTAVSGMKELLGERDECGLITENSEEGLYRGLNGLSGDPALLERMRDKARERGSIFHRERTVREAEAFLEGM